MKRRNRWVLSMVLVCALIMSACSGSGGGTQTQKADEPQTADTAAAPAEVTAAEGNDVYEVTEPVTIEFWHTLEEMYRDDFNQLVDEFEKENPNITVWNTSWYEQLNYMTKTNHIWCDLDYFMNEAKYQSMDDEAKAVIDRAAAEAQAFSMEYSEEMETYYEEKLLNEGGLELCEVDLTPFREKVEKSVWAEVKASVDGAAELIEGIQALAE